MDTGLLVDVDRVAFPRSGAVAEGPFPGGDFAEGLILERDLSCIHVDHLERPSGLDLLLEFLFERHQPEGAEVGCVAYHLRVVRQAVKAVALASVEVEHGPRKTDELVFLQLGGDGVFGTGVRCVVGRGDPELEDELTALTVLEVVGVGRVGVREFTDPGLAAPHQSPSIVHGWCVDVIVLRVHTLEGEVILDRVRDERVGDERTAGQVSVDRDLEDVVSIATRVEAREVPEFVAGR